MERIQQAELTAETLTVPPGFDAASRLGHAWGVSDEELVHVRLRFHTPLAAQRARASQWHPSQREQVNPDGTTDLTFDLNGLSEITPWVLGWGGSVEIIKPDVLKQRIGAAAQEMIARNG